MTQAYSTPMPKGIDAERELVINPALLNNPALAQDERVAEYAPAWANDVSHHVLADKLVQRYQADSQRHQIKHPSSDYGPKTTQPWQAYAERLMAAAMVAKTGAGMWLTAEGKDGDTRKALSTYTVAMMMAADAILGRRWPVGTYLWTQRAEELVRSAPLPKIGKIADLLSPYPAMFFANEVALNHGLYSSDWMFMTQDSMGNFTVLIPLFHRRTHESMVKAISIPGDMQFPEGVEEKYMDKLDGEDRKVLVEVIGRLLNRVAFVKETTIINPQRHRLSKNDRREIAKSDASVSPDPDPLVHVCVLRREVADYQNRVLGEQVEWKHQWWVTGHTRNQWCPSTKTYKPTWIAPYIKGPPDKPFMEKVYAVSR